MRVRTIVTTSWDDGHPLDLRLAELLERYGMPATFYVPTSNPERRVMRPHEVCELAGRFELGAHTRHHRRLPGLEPAELRDEVVGGRNDLEDLTGRRVSLFCYPGGRYDRRVRDAVEQAGYLAARTTAELRTDLGPDPWLTPTTLHAFPHPRAVRARHALRERNWPGLRRLAALGDATDWVDMGRRLFDQTVADGGVWHLWGHSWEIDAGGLWADLEELLRYVAGHAEVSYVANGATADDSGHPGMMWGA